MVPACEDEREKLRQLREWALQPANSPLFVTIAPTLTCNMACGYCIQRCNKIARDGEMSLDVQNSTVKHIMSEMPGRPKLSLCWYGGEPLLARNAIGNMSNRLIAYGREIGVSYGASIITNGYLLTKDICRWLRDECCVDEAQITLDGLPETHNRRRPLRNGSSSFEGVMEGIRCALQYMNVRIRINIDDENCNELFSLVELLRKELGFASNMKIYASEVCDSCETTILKQADKTDKVALRIKEVFSNPKLFPEFPMKIHSKMANPCGTGWMRILQTCRCLRRWMSKPAFIRFTLGKLRIFWKSRYPLHTS